MPEITGRVKRFICEDNDAVIKMTIEGRSPNMRHVARTHRVDLDWLCKEIFHDDFDRGVWHFQQDLPLLAYDQQGTCLIHSTWLQIM